LKQITPDISNSIEKIDDKTFKQICSKCGGKGFYLHQNFNLTTNKIDKQEILSCDCEGGFNYGIRENS